MSEAKLLIKDIFRLANRHNTNKVEFETQTVDRKHGDISITIKIDNYVVDTSDELYNYIIEKYKDLRNHSDVREFKETEVIIKDMLIDGNKTTSTLQFTLGYMDFKIKMIKEVL